MMTIVLPSESGDRELTFAYHRWRRTLKLPRFAIDRWRYVMLGILAIGDGTAAMWPTAEELTAAVRDGKVTATIVANMPERAAAEANIEKRFYRDVEVTIDGQVVPVSSVEVTR